MNGFATIRLPGISIAKGEARTLSSSAAPHGAESEISDETLIAQICGGSREALADLFRRHARIVRGVAYRVLRDASEADDLLQDIFLLIHRKCGMFDASRGPARFWILQMTYHRAIARRRYLNSRHFYTRVDLDDLDDVGRELAGPPTGSSRFIDSAHGLLGREGIERFFCRIVRRSARNSAAILCRRLHAYRDCHEIEADSRECEAPLLPRPGKAAETAF